jgi:hypothetical protein
VVYSGCEIVAGFVRSVCVRLRNRPARFQVAVSKSSAGQLRRRARSPTKTLADSRTWQSSSSPSRSSADAGRSLGRCARPASIAPARTKENELKTQAEGGFPVTFECYGVEVTTPTTFLCNGPPGGP